MSHQWFQKPENALERAIELINMPNSDKDVIRRQKISALEILHDTLTSKRSKSWQMIHQEIMIVYLDICIDLQLGRVAKDGLHQYRNLVLTQNPASLEFVLKYLIGKAEERASDAKRQAHAVSHLVSMDIDDLEATETPEALLLSTTTSDSFRDRADRELLVPWLRFLWEAYRTVLDILRCNSKLENLYYEIAIKAFQFCLEYTRKLEFRRLCDILRVHLSTLQKHEITPTSQSLRQMRGWEGWSKVSVELHLQLRYEQLKAASKLENWTESFRTIEDIHAVMGLLERTPKVSLLATYFEKLTEIFWVSNNYLFHAYALYKFYTLSKNHNTKLTEDHLQKMASRVLLASMSIPIIEEMSVQTPLAMIDNIQDGSGAASNAYDSSDIYKEKTLRMASLMGFTNTPTRAHLLQTLLNEDILSSILPQVSELYNHLEKQFHPLKVVSKVKPILEGLRMQKELSPYIPALETLLVQRLLSQLTQVYSSVTIAHFKSLLHGLHVSFHQVEQLIVRSVGHFSVRIDHRNGCLRFGETSLESMKMRKQLTFLGTKLQMCVDKIGSKSSTETTVVSTRATLFKRTKKNLSLANEQMLERKILIEKKKEEVERLQQEEQLKEERKHEEYESQRQELEKARLEQEAQRREKGKRQRIKDEIALKETKRMLSRLGRDVESLGIEDLQSVDREKIIREAKEKEIQLKEELQKKLADQAKRLDYIVRATREAELPILAASYEAQREQDRHHHEACFKETLERSRLDFEHARSEKTRLQRMLQWREGFAEARQVKRQALYANHLLERRAQKAVQQLENKIERASVRYEDQMRIRKEEDAQKLREETERLEREAEVEAAERERQAKAMELEEKKVVKSKGSKIEDEWQHISSKNIRSEESSSNTWRSSRVKDQSPSRVSEGLRTVDREDGRPRFSDRDGEYRRYNERDIGDRRLGGGGRHFSNDRRDDGDRRYDGNPRPSNPNASFRQNRDGPFDRENPPRGNERTRGGPW